MCDNDSNTQMSITVDNINHNIGLCDAHADECSMKHIREKVSEIIQNVNSAVAEAQAVGIIMSQADAPLSAQSAPQLNSESTPTSETPSTPAPAQSAVVNSDEVDLKETPTQREAPIKSLPAKKKKSDPVTIAGQTLAEDANVEVQQFIGRDGKPVELPLKVEGELGTTDIRLVKVDDNVIQQRFKNLDSNAPDKNQGYNDRPCMLCKGTGFTMDKNLCKKCNGSGMQII